jgi:hypothetical protein
LKTNTDGIQSETVKTALDIIVIRSETRVAKQLNQALARFEILVVSFNGQMVFNHSTLKI